MASFFRRGGSGGGSSWQSSSVKMAVLENTVVLDADSTTFDIGIPEFDDMKDYIEIHKNSTYMKRGIDYIVTNGIVEAIDSGGFFEGDVFDITVFRTDSVAGAGLKWAFVSKKGERAEIVSSITVPNYVVATDNLQVLIEGIEINNSNYTRTDETTITFNQGIEPEYDIIIRCFG